MGKKRGQGEGSVYKRKDGLWVAALFHKGKRVVKYSKTQRGALDWLQETRAQVQSGIAFTAGQITLGNFLQDWLGAYKVSIRPITFQQYSQIVNQYLVPTLGTVKLKDLRADHIQRLYNAKLAEGKSERTVLLIHAVLHRALNQALRWNIIPRNPASAVSRPKFRRKEMKTWTATQARIFLDAALGTRYETLYWLALTTGLREGELLGLKWSDLDWTNKRLKVQRQLQRNKGRGLVFSEPKTESGKRAILLSNSMTKRLLKQCTIQSYEKLFAGELWQDYDLVFPSTLGTPLDPRNLYRNFKNILKQADIPDIRFHDLRHTAATLMLQEGVHPKVVQERLGHSDIALTLNTYSHVLPDMQQGAAEKIDQLLEPEKAPAWTSLLTTVETEKIRTVSN